jgi:hypothetical protein
VKAGVHVKVVGACQQEIMANLKARFYEMRRFTLLSLMNRYRAKLQAHVWRVHTAVMLV